jgi:hypothetical protein
MENKETFADAIANFQKAVDNFKKELSKPFMPFIEYLACKIEQFKKR